MAESLKVDKDQFEAAIRALLNTPPKQASEITSKRTAKPEPAAKKRAKKKSH